MGGFCSVRDRCPHFNNDARSMQTPAERLCIPGRDGVRLVEVTPYKQIEVNILQQQEASREQLVHWQ